MMRPLLYMQAERADLLRKAFKMSLTNFTLIYTMAKYHLFTLISSLIPSLLPNPLNSEMEKTANTITTTAVSMIKSKFSIY